MQLNGAVSLAFRSGWHGALAWGAFAVVEAAFFVMLPAARESALVLVPPSRVASWALLFSLYMAGGFAAGLAAGAAAALVRGFALGARSPAPELGQLTLVIAWAAHLAAVVQLSRSTWLSLATALLIAAALFLRLSARRSGAAPPAWTTWLAGPWGAALVLLVPIVLRDTLHVTWLIARVGMHAAALKVAAAAVVTAATAALLAALGRLTLRFRWPEARIAAVRAAALPACAAAVLAAGWASDARVLSRLRQPAARRAPAPAPTGVLLVTMDSVRADHLSTHGYPHDTTPGLRALLSHATLFRRAVAASDMSLGTHASLFTGVYPARHGAYEAPGYPAGRPLGAGHATLAERLGAAGYASIGAAANGYFLNAAYGLTRGFVLFDVRANDRLEMQSLMRRVAGRLPGRGFSVHRRAPELNAVLLAGIDAARAGGRPFFAFANYMEAHAPYTADPSLAGAFPGYDPDARFGGTAFLGRGSRPVFDERERRHLVSQYDASIATLDRELARLFAALRDRGVYDGMLIVITSDHGEMLGEQGAFGHGTGLAEEVLRVPLIVKLPWQQEGRVVEGRVSQVDLMPTILEAVGLGRDSRLDGRSLIGTEAEDGRIIMAESPPARALYLGPYKLLLDAGGNRGLFDVETDPAQRKDLLDAPDALVVRARRALEAQLSPPRDAPRPAVDPAVLDRLRSLGYVK